MRPSLSEAQGQDLRTLGQSRPHCACLRPLPLAEAVRSCEAGFFNLKTKVEVGVAGPLVRLPGPLAGANLETASLGPPASGGGGELPCHRGRRRGDLRL